MIKIENHVFQSLFAAYSLPKTSRFRASLIWKDLAMIGIKKGMKKIEKIPIKIKYLIHDYKGFGLVLQT